MGPTPFTLFLLIGLAYSTHLGLNRADLRAKWLFSTETIRFRKEWYRIFSSALLHADWGHFFSNAVTLLFFAAPIERGYGPVAMLGVFAVSILGGNLVSWSLHRHTDYRSLGASGGACGILFACILLYPGSILIFGIVPGWLYAVGYMAYTFHCMKTGRQAGIGHDAHFGGFLTGIVLAMCIDFRAAIAAPFVLTLLLIMGIGGLWYTHANPGRTPGFLRWKISREVAKHQEKREAANAQTIDDILDKVSSEGLQSLSDREKRLLNQASKKRKGKG